MSQGFGVDIYGIPFYGPQTPITPGATPLTPSVAPFTATQADYAEIVLQWTAPQNTPWKFMQLVRSVYGYPSTAQDGVLLAQFTSGTLQKTYDDAGLNPGTIYYYTMFVTLEAPAWSNAITYPANFQVLSGGQYWTSIASGNLNHTPAAGSTFWSPTAYVPTWLPAGYAANLALANEGYGSLLYARTPQPYKLAGSDTLGNTAIDNQSLQNYYNVIGFGLDILKNRYDSFLQLNNADVVSATDLDILGQQLGITTDYMTTPQQRRQRIKTATVNYQLKGEPQSVHNVIAQLTGWDSITTEGTNLYPSADSTAAVHPLYDVWNANTTYFPNQIIQFNGYNYKNILQSVGSAQAPTGAATNNTWWQVQQNILDTTVSKNPATGWYYSNQNIGASSTFNGVMTGLPHPTNTAINNYNGFNFTFVSSLDVQFQNWSSLLTPAWASGTNYAINANVLQGGIYYTAIKPSGPGTPYGAITPGTNSQFWKAFYYVPATDNPNAIKDSAPVGLLPGWVSTQQYTAGTRVQYQGIVYQAALNNINQQPSGFYYSNANWVFVEPYQKSISNSVYAALTGGTGTNFTTFTYPNFLDIHGNVIQNYSSSYSVAVPTNYGIGFAARHVVDYTDMAGSTEAALQTAKANGIIGPASSWATQPQSSGLWKLSFGMASVNQSVAGTQTYSIAFLPNGSGGLGGRHALTFLTDFVDTAHKTHGIVFAFNTTSQFWYATRTSMYSVVAGVETKVATWSRLNNGDRIVIDIDAGGQNITAYKYARDGKGTLIQIGSAFSTPIISGGFGYIQKYSATGAL